MCGQVFFIFLFSDTQVQYYLGFEPEVQVHPLPKPEPTKRFGFGYSAEPNPQTSGLKSGSEGLGTGLRPVYSKYISWHIKKLKSIKIGRAHV